MSPSASFTKFWSTDLTRDAFLQSADIQDLKNLRLVCQDFAYGTSRHLFRDTKVTFRSTTFTKPARMAALERIGQYIRTFNFDIPHTSETFLPPLLDPVTGEELSFVHMPQVRAAPGTAAPPTNTTLPGNYNIRNRGATTAAAAAATAAAPTATGATIGRPSSPPKYGTWEMTDLLVKQYPPLFHAAMNVNSFVCALSCMPALQHLIISCDGQDPAHGYRRSVVDYALTSLRIAIEQAPLPRLDSLSLLPIHPSGIQYLRPMAGIGALPNSCKRWTQIRKLEIQMECFPFEKGQATDHLKFLHSYLQGFPELRKFIFRWQNDAGPCPLSLATEPALCELANRSHACPKTRHYLRPLKFRHLQFMDLENAVLDASQVSDFLIEHRHSLLEFNFENVTLRSGTWDDALEPWRKLSGCDEWDNPQAEVMEVPFVLGAATPKPEEYVSPVPSPQQHKKRKKKKRRTRSKREEEVLAEVPLNNDLFASTAAMLMAEEQPPPPRTGNSTFRTLREGLSNWARSRAKPSKPFWGNHDHMKKMISSPVIGWCQ